MVCLDMEILHDMAQHKCAHTAHVYGDTAVYMTDLPPNKDPAMGKFVKL